MFEFHGWASIHYHTHDTDCVRQDRCWTQLVAHVDSVPNDLVQLQRYNGCDSFHIAGQHNHRSDYVIDLFRWGRQMHLAHMAFSTFATTKTAIISKTIPIVSACGGSHAAN